MLLKLVCLVATAQLVVSQITFKNGNIGVDFAGYQAEAGLGGILTGNAADGGLQASARTPNGQAAVAGLGGSTANGASGGLYAGATAGEGIGATATLGGDAGTASGYGGAEAHAGGVSKQVVGVSTGTVGSGTVITSEPAVSAVESDTVVGIQPAVYQVQKTIQPVVVQRIAPATVVQKTVQPVVVQKTVQPIVYQWQKTYQPIAVQPAVVKRVQTYAPQRVNYVYRKNFVYPAIYKGFYKTYQPLAPIPRPVYPAYSFGKIFNFGFTPIKTVAVAPVAAAPVAAVESAAPVTQAPIPDDQRPVLYQKTISYQPSLAFKQVDVAQRVQSDEGDDDSNGADSNDASSSSTVTKAPQTITIDYTGYKTALYNDIFNIPINALRAVNTLLNNKASGAYDFTKTIKVI